MNARERVEPAAKHLARSVKGRCALRALLDWLDDSGPGLDCDQAYWSSPTPGLDWLDDSGLGLDAENQECVLDLLHHAWGGYAGTVMELLREHAGCGVCGAPIVEARLCAACREHAGPRDP